MIPVISVLAAIASAVGIYLFFFDDPKELIEQFIVSTIGGGRDYRVFILVSVPVVTGLLTYLFLLRLMGKPLSIPFL
ncbi:hypothetical protein [Geothrix sp. 21YS21S-4]|uniref:hypothetical protein n=1 Tax=Geothrix sp. 21YS21S-4 TaxID=3068889 RepID=UPI0027B9129E|nr:hypothetical protein [Geothrix sp. 21YS21S-4]